LSLWPGWQAWRGAGSRDCPSPGAGEAPGWWDPGLGVVFAQARSALDPLSGPLAPLLPQAPNAAGSLRPIVEQANRRLFSPAKEPRRPRETRRESVGLTIAIRNGRVLTITQGTIEGGTVLIEAGKIVSLGRDTPIPAGAEIVDATGLWVTPGLIDAHSHIAIFGEPFVEATNDGNECTDPITPHVRALDAVNPADPAVPDTLSAGVTTVWTGPGSGNVIGGTGMVIKLHGRTIDEMVVNEARGSMKMALGENPKRVYGGQKKFPMTRMGNAAALREALAKGQSYMRKVKKAEDDAARASAEKETKVEPDYPERDLKMEALSKVLTREYRCRIHCHRADDILTAIRIAEEFGLDFSIEHATEGWKVADVLAAKGVTCTVGPNDLTRVKMECENFSLTNAGVLAKKGVKVCIQVDGFSNTRWLPVHAGMLVRYGMPEDEAMKALTINPAELLGLSHRLGSLEPGKDADIALFSGNPLCTLSRCEKVFINGVQVYDAVKSGLPAPGVKSGGRP
jgi:imidazolonepropionase-like amidohydrolase